MSNRLYCVLVFGFAASLFAGCHAYQPGTPDLACNPDDLVPNAGGASYLTLDTEPCVDEAGCEVIDTTYSPLDITDYANLQYREMTLQECIDLALRNSKVFRDLGGTIITAPQVIRGIYGPAIVYSDPQFSEEAALSAFDANVSTSAFFQKNDQASNLTFQGNNGIFRQDFNDYRFQIRKLTPTGTFFALRNTYVYDNNNQTGQTLPDSWRTIFEGEFRHPLLQGSGVLFNRIAGPSLQPGVYGGVLIARTNTEISLARFEAGVRDLVSEVENAYWDLYFAYRNLEAIVEGRDKAYEILIATSKGKAREGTQAQAQAREQYLRFERDVLDAMEGRPVFGTRNYNGTAGGVFLSTGGIRVTERRLRLICCMPINSCELIRTSDEPATSGIQFDWHQSVSEAFVNRQELVEQSWVVKQRELQLLASRNFLKPRLDLIGQYRFRGLGKDLLGGSGGFLDDLNNGTQNSTAFGDLFTGDFQEWQLGAEFSMPIGFRAAHLGVRNAELALSRERAILKEQKREVVFGLSNAFGEMRRTFASLQAAEEQYVAAHEFQYVMQLEIDRGRDRDIELEAQRRVVQAEIAYRRSQVEYMLALKNVHFEKGSYLDFCNISLSESRSNPLADVDVAERGRRRGRPISYVADSPIIARNTFDNDLSTAAASAVSVPGNDGSGIETNLSPVSEASLNEDNLPINQAAPFGNRPDTGSSQSNSFNLSDESAPGHSRKLTSINRMTNGDPGQISVVSGDQATQIPVMPNPSTDLAPVVSLTSAESPKSKDQRSSRRVSTGSISTEATSSAAASMPGPDSTEVPSTSTRRTRHNE